jgi:hypothetical protein
MPVRALSNTGDMNAEPDCISGVPVSSSAKLEIDLNCAQSISLILTATSLEKGCVRLSLTPPCGAKDKTCP